MFSPAVLELDPAAESERIATAIRAHVREKLRRRGAVVGVSGGVDSAVVTALSVRALGTGHVLALFMPDKHSAPDSAMLARAVTDAAGLEMLVEDITPMLEGAGCYARQDEAIRSVVPEYADGWRCKLVLPPVTAGDRLNITRLHVESPDGAAKTVRLTPKAYLQLVAATNFKQRVRKMVEYYHADRLNYAVAGTPNRLEYDQGFFVKQGDGAADFKPIAHLYKTQVYQLAAYLGVPELVRSRPPTTDTFSMPQTQEEFYFALPYDKMDLCLCAFNRGASAEETAEAAGLRADEVERVFRDIAAKRRATAYLHSQPLLVEPVPEV